MKQQFIELISMLGRSDTQMILSNLESLGFFDAPASTRFHLSKKGGLVEHSVKVCRIAMKLQEMAISENPQLQEQLPITSVILTALLHDVCKAEIYKEGFRNVKTESGTWEKMSVYEVDYNYFPAGHGEKSVIRLLQWGVKLTMDEILAIRWHMSAWDLNFHSREAIANLNAAAKKTPLVTLLQCADMLASGIFESNCLNK